MDSRNKVTDLSLVSTRRTPVFLTEHIPVITGHIPHRNNRDVLRAASKAFQQSADADVQREYLLNSSTLESTTNCERLYEKFGSNRCPSIIRTGDTACQAVCDTKTMSP